MDDTTTKRLERILSGIDSTREMEAFLSEPKVTDGYKEFHKYYRSLPQVWQQEDRELIERSGIERSYYYQILKGTKKPGRDKVLRLCLAAGLSLPETTRALELSGNAVLYARDRRDIILTVAVNQKAGVDETNLLLDKYGEEPLG